MKIGRIGFAGFVALAVSVAAASGAEPNIGDAVFVYKPGDPMYEKIKEHLGGIKPGEEKPVPPWPESP